MSTNDDATEKIEGTGRRTVKTRCAARSERDFVEMDKVAAVVEEAGTAGTAIVREDPGGLPGDEAADRLVVGISGYETLLFTPGVAGRFIGGPITQAIPVENLGATP